MATVLKRRYPAFSVTVTLLVFSLFLTAGSALPAWSMEIAPGPEPQVLARVDVADNIETLGLPVYAHLADSAGQEYILTITDRATLETSRRAYVILDADTAGRSYCLARERRSGARVLASGMPQVLVLHDDGLRLIIRETPGVGDLLPPLGFDFKMLPAMPVILPLRGIAPLSDRTFAVNPLVSDIINQVTTENLAASVAGLSGAQPVIVGGAPYTIATRYTRSGAPVENATQFVHEQFQALGLTTSYHAWSSGSTTNRNIVGELRGAAYPDEIVLLTAHLDDMPTGSVAPGADDNASGSAALLVAADIMSRYQFNRTVRLVLFTGEEQGLLGSRAYASSLSGETIVAAVNLDMIAYNTAGTAPVINLHTRFATNPGSVADQAIADTFAGVVGAYGLASALTPVLRRDGDTYSDHSSFWDAGFAAVLAIEDDYDDFNPSYHTVNDTVSRFDWGYFTAFAQAGIGTVAQLADVSGELPRDLILTAVPETVSFFRGGTGTATVTATPWGDFRSPVSLTATGLPTGMTAAFAPSVIPAPGSGSSLLTLAATQEVRPGNYPVTVTATGGGMLKTATLVARVTGPVITTATLPAGTGNVAYSKTLTAAGGTTPYAWSLVPGSSLPNGMTLSAAGVLGGTPVVVGEFTFTVQVSDSNLVVDTATLTLNISAAPLVMTTASLKSGVVGTFYVMALAAGGGLKPYTWSITAGTLPPGIGLDTATGLLSGAPATGGTFTVELSVRDSQSTPATVSKSFTVTAAIAPLAITTTALPDGAVGAAYKATLLTGAGGVKPYLWSVAAGTLPPGIGLASSTGVIGGTPAAAGTYPVTIKVEDYGGTPAVTREYTVIITALPLAITTAGIPAGSVGTSYPALTLTATGGTRPFYWSIPTGKLPPGLTLNNATGVLSGVPAGAGAYPVAIKVEDYNGTPAVTREFTIVVTASAPAITTTTLPSGTAGVVYPYSALAATGGIRPYSWSVVAGRLPPGIGYSSSTGSIGGTPAAAGDWPVTFRLSDANGSTVTRDLTLSVTAAPLTIVTATLPPGASGTAYTRTVLAATGGVKPYMWGISAGQLPPGIGLNTASGTLSGTPSAKGTFTFTLQLNDLQSPPASTTRAFSITVN